jgi:hypothetical protein
MTYDIIYSVGCHEHPDGFLDFLRNLFYYNKAFSVCVVVNCNRFMYDALHDKIDEFSGKVYVMPNPWDKRMYTFDILETHVQTMEYCKKLKLSATYFIPLASNCMFHKHLTCDYIVSLRSTPVDIADPSGHPQTNWQWPMFYRNVTITNILNADGIFNYQGSQHEGMLLKFDIMEKIATYLREKNCYNQVQCQFPFEEILLVTLYAYFTGQKPPLICKVFWNNPGYMPKSISEIEETTEPCIKRVMRDYNNPTRKWLRERTNNYTS